jgi:tartrate dehydrogenase/decarboxylase/D-malate dehydrogenase
MTYQVAVIPGDGIGPEVIEQGIAIVDAASSVSYSWEVFPWGSAYFGEHGRMMPTDALDRLDRFDAIYLGACGWPTVPDHVSLWGLLLPIRKAFDLYVNVRPVRCLPGLACPLAGRGPADVDMLFIRENTEGEYSGAGGRVHSGHPGELAVEVPVFTRFAIERCARYAYQQARSRRRRLTSVTKSNASRFAYVLWDEVVARVGREEFPDVEVVRVHVDAMAARMVLQPDSIDVVVGSNLFADILSDLGAAIQGSLGLAASANLNPERTHPSLFEPVHGSAPDIAGQGRANPIGAISSAAMMMAFLGDDAGAAAVESAVESVTRSGLRTADLGGAASTSEMGAAIASTAGQVRLRNARTIPARTPSA